MMCSLSQLSHPSRTHFHCVCYLMSSYLYLLPLSLFFMYFFNLFRSLFFSYFLYLFIYLFYLFLPFRPINDNAHQFLHQLFMAISFLLLLSVDLYLIPSHTHHSLLTNYEAYRCSHVNPSLS